MKVSQKCEYALRAMLELAQRAQQIEPVRTAEIARNQKIPEKFLELILVELRRAGLIASHRGPVGGHRIARLPQYISIGEIWRAIDGPSFENGSKADRSGDPFRSVWEETDRAIASVVDNATLADICKKLESRHGVPDYTI